MIAVQPKRNHRCDGNPEVAENEAYVEVDAGAGLTLITPDLIRGDCGQLVPESLRVQPITILGVPFESPNSVP
jgi:hypothetical protein